MPRAKAQPKTTSVKAVAEPTLAITPQQIFEGIKRDYGPALAKRQKRKAETSAQHQANVVKAHELVAATLTNRGNIARLKAISANKKEENQRKRNKSTNNPQTPKLYHKHYIKEALDG